MTTTQNPQSDYVQSEFQKAKKIIETTFYNLGAEKDVGRENMLFATSKHFEKDGELTYSYSSKVPVYSGFLRVTITTNNKFMNTYDRLCPAVKGHVKKPTGVKIKFSIVNHLKDCFQEKSGGSTPNAHYAAECIQNLATAAAMPKPAEVMKQKLIGKTAQPAPTVTG